MDSSTGARLQEVDVNPKGVGPLSVSPGGERLAVAVYWEKVARVFDWDGRMLTEIRTLKGHSGNVSGLAYSPDGKFLASGDRDGFKLWHATTLVEDRAIKTSASELAWTPDSQTLFASVATGPPKPVHTFTRWGVGAQKELPALAVEVSAQPVRAFHCLSRDGNVLFLADQHGASHVRAIDIGRW